VFRLVGASSVIAELGYHDVGIASVGTVGGSGKRQHLPGPVEKLDTPELDQRPHRPHEADTEIGVASVDRERHGSAQVVELGDPAAEVQRFVPRGDALREMLRVPLGVAPSDRVGFRGVGESFDRVQPQGLEKPEARLVTLTSATTNDRRTRSSRASASTLPVTPSRLATSTAAARENEPANTPNRRNKRC
jgi:hypothetical protein